MYFIETVYGKTLPNTFKTLEEAREWAEDSAAKDYDEYRYVIGKVEYIVQGEKPRIPVTSVEVTTEVAAKLLEVDEEKNIGKIASFATEV